MRTEHSWTELRRGAADLRAILAFRSSQVAAGSRRRLAIAAGFVLGMTVAASVVPAYVSESLDGEGRGEIVAVLGALYLGFLVLAVLAAVASGGGREVLPREQAVAYPISTVTEHLGALLLAPLNIAWLIQAWTILGATSYALGPNGPIGLAASLVPVLVWIVFATATGQVVGWTIEGIRRGPRGMLVARSINAVLLLAGSIVALTGNVADLLDRSPTVRIYFAAAYGAGEQWTEFLRILGPLALGAVALVLLGLVPARWALLRPLREELRLESGQQTPRPLARSELAAMTRIDRASVWRAVPLRRGLVVLAMMPAAIVLASDLTWDLVVVLPGLVASGAALLFGVNAWCLDGRGALWRDSLPVAPQVAYASKVWVLFEVVLAASVPTVLFAGVRAGAPTSAELASVLAATVVVAVQVVSASARWSVTRPYAVDMRSARATPAPPVVMAGYSARLALRTTLIGLMFSATSLASNPAPALLLAVPLFCWPAYRIMRTADAWADPPTRARVIAVVAT